MRVAVIGTGLMGAPLAERLASQGYAVTAWNRTPGRAQGLEQVDVADEPLFAVADAEVIILTLSDFAAIEGVMLGPSMRARLSGRTVIQMGTIGPSQSRALATEFAGLGADYLEAPVLGSRPEAKQGTLLLMVGGDRAVFERWLPLLRAFGPKPVLMGPVGHGAAAKLALNQLIAGLTTSFAASLGLIRETGVDLDRFMGILRDSAVYAPTFDKKLDKMLRRDFANPNFPLRHLHKDVGLFIDAAAEAGLDIGPQLAIRELLDDAVVRGLEDEDYSALYQSVHPS